MADARVADLTDSGVPADDDLLYLVDVSAGPPRDRKLTIDNLRAAIGSPIDIDLDINGEGGVATWRMLTARTAGAGTPVELLDKDGGRISLNEFGGSIVTLSFSALFVASSLSSDAAGYKIEGVVSMYSGPGTAIAVGPFFTVTLAEDVDWSVIATVDAATDTLQFHYTGTLGNGCAIVGHVHLVFLVAE